jgi:hypothetical protein
MKPLFCLVFPSMPIQIQSARHGECGLESLTLTLTETPRTLFDLILLGGSYLSHALHSQ